MVREEKPMFGDRQPPDERVLDFLSGSSVPAYTLISPDQWEIIKQGLNSLNWSLSIQRNFNKLTPSYAQQFPIGTARVRESYSLERSQYTKSVQGTLSQVGLNRYMYVMKSGDGLYHLVPTPGFSVSIEDVTASDGTAEKGKMKKVKVTRYSPEAAKIRKMSGGLPPII